MKFSDKALRLIGRELIEKKPAATAEKKPQGLQLRSLRRASKAAVLPFKKRLR
jgi:hypothetical protein